MLDRQGALLKYVVPSLGGFLSALMYISPIIAAIRIYKSQTLGEFNLVPYPLMIFNTIVWTIYASTLSIPSAFFVAFPNWVGIMSGTFILALTYPLASSQTRFQILGVLMFVTGLFFPTVFALSQLLEKDEFSAIIGYITIAIQLIFFASPLLNAIEIIRTRSSASLYWPLALTTAISAGLWTVYGFVLEEQAIYIPNGLGALFGVVQLILCLIYPAGRIPLFSSSPSGKIVSISPPDTSPLHPDDDPDEDDTLSHLY